MRDRQSLTVLGTSLVISCLVPVVADAQVGGAFGQLNLPNNDFTWVWGDLERTSSRKTQDLLVRSADSGFQCTLKTRFALGSRLSRAQEREIEQDLRTTPYFIQDTAYVMNSLDRERQLDWATLECVKPQSNLSEAEQQERLDKLRERAMEKGERRRARRDDN